MLRSSLVWLVTCSLSLLCAQASSKFIHVDQFGYRPGAEKVAVLSDPQSGQNASDSYSPGNTLEVRNAATDATTWTGTPVQWQGGATHGLSGDRGWWLDFSTVTTPGDYYLLDPTTGERSATFTIAENVYDDLLKDVGRAFFYNRCNAPKAAPYAESNWTDGDNFGNALQDGDCSYVYDRENAALRRDLTGGWFDAGDYNKYVTFAHSAVHDLLWAYTESPAVFTDAWNIPESGNGIPDLLDEVKWEIDWLRKMINADGSTIIKMGSIEYSDNASAPPSNNFDRRYYGPTCTSASIDAASMLAHTAIVFDQVPVWSTYATEITTTAETAFAYWVAARDAGTLEYNCDDGTIKAGDADRSDTEQKEAALTAAVYLFARTGKSEYNDYVRDNLYDAEYMNGGWWGPYKMALVDALIYYRSLSDAHAGTVSEIQNKMTPHVRDDWNGFYGFNEDDLYRAFMPASEYVWGSNQIACNFANINRVMSQIVPTRKDALERKADHMIHYLHGVNPLGLAFLSNMNGRGAEHSLEEIYHTWFNNGTDWDNARTSRYGPAPGFLSGGPNPTYKGTATPPLGEPVMKSYRDWNNGSPEESWEITEPAIYYQAAYLRSLAAISNREIVLPVTYRAPLTARPLAKSILLEWWIETETNASHYAVEYRSEHNAWQTIGRVSATGTSRYRFDHRTPREGENVYRLKQVDQDGAFAYSNLARAHFHDRYADITLFPNPAPANGSFQLTNLPAGTELRLVDASGRILRRTFLRGSSTEISTNGLPVGWYHLELSQGGEGVVWQRKLLVE